MKKIFALAVMLFALCGLAYGQGQRSHTFKSVSADVGLGNIGSGIAYHQLTWYVVGTAPASCTVALDSSSDGVTWSAGGVITGQDCTSNGQSSVVNSSVNYVRMNMTALTANRTVVVVWNGYVTNPGGGSPGGSNGQLQYDDSGSFGGVAGSSVNGSTGAITLTAGADTTTPLTISQHSGTQSAALGDFDETASGGTADAIFNFSSVGSGSFGGLPATVKFDAISDSGAWPTVWTNRAGTSGYFGGIYESQGNQFCLQGLNPAGDVFPTICMDPVTNRVILGGGSGTAVRVSDLELGADTPVVTVWQGTDTKAMTAGTISGTAAPLCTDSNGGATTSGCGTQAVVTGGNAFGSNETFLVAACETSFAPTTVSGGATTTTGQTCLPAGAIIDAVVYRITTTITTASSFTVGDSGSATRYCGTQSTLTSGTVGICTAAGYYLNSSALGVKFTPNTTPGAGAVRFMVYYHTWTAPTS